VAVHPRRVNITPENQSRRSWVPATPPFPRLNTVSGSHPNTAIDERAAPVNGLADSPSVRHPGHCRLTQTRLSRWLTLTRRPLMDCINSRWSTINHNPGGSPAKLLSLVAGLMIRGVCRTVVQGDGTQLNVLSIRLSVRRHNRLTRDLLSVHLMPSHRTPRNLCLGLESQARTLPGFSLP